MYTYTSKHTCVCVFVYMHKYIDPKTLMHIHKRHLRSKLVFRSFSVFSLDTYDLKTKGLD